MYETFLGFAFFMFMSSITPGPNNVLLVFLGGRIGVRRGLPFLSGSAAGVASLGFLLVMLVGGLVSFLDQLTLFIRFFGASMLLWICWKIASSPPPNSSQSPDGLQPQHPSPSALFLEALLFQWVNPKVWIVIVSAISVYLNLRFPLFLQALILAIVFGLCMILGGFIWLAAGSTLIRFLQKPFRARCFNVSMAILLIVSMVPALLGNITPFQHSFSTLFPAS